MKYNAIQARNHAANLFFQAAEEAEDLEVRKALRGIGDDIMADHSGAFSPEKAKELETLGASIGEYARANVLRAVENYSERVRQVLRSSRSDSEGGGKMGIIQKIFGGGKEKKADPNEEKIRDLEVKAFEQQQKYELHMKRYEDFQKKYDRQIQAATAEPKGSPRYTRFYREAVECARDTAQEFVISERYYAAYGMIRNALRTLQGAKDLGDIQLPDVTWLEVTLEDLAKKAQEADVESTLIQEMLDEKRKALFGKEKSSHTLEDTGVSEQVAQDIEKRAEEEAAAAKAKADAEAAEAAARVAALEAELEAARKAVQEAQQQAEAEKREAAEAPAPAEEKHEEAAKAPAEAPAEAAQVSVAAE